LCRYRYTNYYFGTRWRFVINFRFPPLYSLYSLDETVAKRKKKQLPFAGNVALLAQSVAILAQFKLDFKIIFII
jgi:hypothetical protein